MDTMLDWNFSNGVNMPTFRDDSQLLEILEFEAQQQIPYPMNEVYYGFAMTDVGTVECETVVFGTKSDEVNSVLKQLWRIGFEPVKVCSNTAALMNTVAFHGLDGTDDAFVVFDLGDPTVLVIKNKDRYFSRTLSLSVKHGEHNASRLCAEILRTINVFASLNSPGIGQRKSTSPRVRIWEMKCIKKLEDILSLPCEPFQIDSLFETDSPQSRALLLKHPCATAIAIGHALTNYTDMSVRF